MNKQQIDIFLNSMHVVQKCIQNKGSQAAKIIFTNGKSCTDSSSVWIKVGKADRMFCSFLHEQGHLSFTNFSAFTNLTKIRRQALNVLEDVRIDKLNHATYPGAFSIYKKGNKDLVKQCEKIERSGDLSDVFLYILLIGLRNEGHLVHFALKNVSGFITKPIAFICEKYAEAAALSAKTTFDALNLADKLLLELNELLDDDSKSDGNDDSIYGFGNSTPTFKTCSMNMDRGELLDKSDNLVVDDELLPLLNACSSVHINIRLMGTVDLVNRAHGRNVTMALKAPLRSLQQQRNRIRVGLNEFGDSIASDLLVNARLGERQVFRTDARRKNPNLAVTVLTDASSSMAGSKAIQAATATYGLAHALESVRGVSTELLIYGSFGNMQLIKGFNEKASQASFFWPNLEGTATGEAMLYALPRLWKRNEEKKVLFVITDGESYEEPIKNAIEMAKQMDITVIAIGISVNKLVGFENVTQIKIDSAHELPKKFREQLMQFM
jgi:hypothetical protein